MLQRVYWEIYDDGELSDESINILASSCSITYDDVAQKLRYFEILSGFFELESIDFLMKFRNTPIIGKQCVLSVVQKMYVAHEVSTVFAEACEEAIHEFKSSFPMNANYLNIVLE